MLLKCYYFEASEYVTLFGYKVIIINIWRMEGIILNNICTKKVFMWLRLRYYDVISINFLCKNAWCLVKCSGLNFNAYGCISAQTFSIMLFAIFYIFLHISLINVCVSDYEEVVLHVKKSHISAIIALNGYFLIFLSFTFWQTVQMFLVVLLNNLN